MKKYAYLLLCFLLLLGACGKKERELPEETPRYDTEEPVLDGDMSDGEQAPAKPMSLSDMLEDITDAFDDSDPAVWYRHYHNRSIVYEDGFTYRIFSDGIYRRAAGSSQWDALYQGEMSQGHALGKYKEFLYFTLNREGADPKEHFVPQTLWQLNLDTLESREIGNMVEDLPYIFSIYNGNLYIGSSLFGALRYDVYPLDSQGMPGEKMDEASPDFICAEQNAFSLEENTYREQTGGAGPYYSPEMLEMEEEVLPIPDCAAMLNGYFITKKIHTEAAAHFYLTNSATKEQQLLFDAYDILAVTPTGIYYYGDGTQIDTFHYYSFLQKEALSFLNEEISYDSFYLLTYDRAWLYFYDHSHIMRMSRSTGETEIFLHTVPENLNSSYCAVDPEYFYLDDEMIPL